MHTTQSSWQHSHKPVPGGPRYVPALSTFLAMALSTSSLADTRQHGNHVHGSAQLNIAVEEQTLLLEYIAPVANILGFEHEANTDEQKGMLQRAQEILQSDKILSLPGDAGCTMTHMEMKQEADHEKHDEHAQEQLADDEAIHSEFHVEHAYQCDKIDALTYIEVNLFEYFPGNETITTQVITPNGQKGLELAPGNTRLILP